MADNVGGGISPCQPPCHNKGQGGPGTRDPGPPATRTTTMMHKVHVSRVVETSDKLEYEGTATNKKGVKAFKVVINKYTGPLGMYRPGIPETEFHRITLERATFQVLDGLSPHSACALAWDLVVCLKNGFPTSLDAVYSL